MNTKEFTKEFTAQAKRVGLSPMMLSALDDVAHCESVWWHDVGAGSTTAKALWERGLIEGDVTPCGGTDHNHPGYCTITAKGLEVLERAKRK